MTPSPSSQEEARELTVALDRVREELRVTMLEQPITGERRTYSDGFASGLAHAIHRIDSINDPTRPTPDLGDVDELVSKVAANLSLVITSAYLMCKDGRGNEAAHMLAERAIIALRAALDKNG
jgi:hypothetical protein